MRMIRYKCKVVSVILVSLLIMMSVPCQSIFAAMISTEELINSDKAHEARIYIQNVLSREEIQNAFIKQGIAPLEAQARINSLTDKEAIQLAEHLDKIPAGGSAVGTIASVALVVFIVLVITDILGLTDIFPFIKSQAQDK